MTAHFSSPEQLKKSSCLSVCLSVCRKSFVKKLPFLEYKSNIGYFTVVVRVLTVVTVVTVVTGVTIVTVVTVVMEYNCNEAEKSYEKFFDEIFL